MARMIPVLTNEQLARLPSKAEAYFYRVCRDQLPGATVVFHSVGLIRLSLGGAPQDGEADFTIIDPTKGVLVVEVKGGGIEFDPVSGRWTSTGATGKHLIKDPFTQAKDNKHGLIDFLRADPKWQQIRLGRALIGHSVCFPDLSDVTRLRLPQAPQAIIAGRNDLLNLPKWLSSAFEYWHGNDARHVEIGNAGLARLESILAPRVRVRPMLATALEDEEQVRVQLTEQQGRLLRALGRRRRAVVCGGAGTGKTLLALSRARELAESGRRTLLVCYNAPLADHLKASAQDVKNLDAMTFHQLCSWRVSVALSKTGRDLRAEAEASFPGSDTFDVLLPYALAASTEISDFRYDAIIVDEAQDFEDDYWLGIELLLGRKESWLYLFFDHNQSLYRAASELPVSETPFVLTANCRNTRHIHQAAYKFYAGEPTDPPPIEGEPIEVLPAVELPDQARKITQDIAKLMMDDGLSPSDFAVLHISGNPRLFYEAIRSRSLPRKAKWAVETHRTMDGVVLDTVARFKGLEASVIYLCGLEGLDAKLDRELLYVGLSRAKGRIKLVGSADVAARLGLAQGGAAVTTSA